MPSLAESGAPSSSSSSSAVPAGSWQEDIYLTNRGGHANDSSWSTVGHAPSNVKPHLGELHGNGGVGVVPVPAKPTGSLLNLYTAQQRSKASTTHIEFAGRSYGDIADLYPQMRYVVSHHGDQK